MPNSHDRPNTGNRVTIHLTPALKNIIWCGVTKYDNGVYSGVVMFRLWYNYKKKFTRRSNIIDQYASSGQVTNHILNDQWPTSLQNIEALNSVIVLIRWRELLNVNDDKFEDSKGVIRSCNSIVGHTIQWPERRKRRTMIYKAIPRKIKIA